MSELIPVQYEYDEQAARDAAELLTGNGISASVEQRRGSYAVVVGESDAEAAIAELGRPAVTATQAAAKPRRLGLKALIAVLASVGVVLLASTVWGIAILWGSVIVGSIALAVIHEGRAPREPVEGVRSSR